MPLFKYISIDDHEARDWICRKDVRNGTVHALAELLGTVVLVEEVVSDLLQISQVAVEQGTANGQEVGVPGVLDLDNTPGVLSGAHFPVINLDKVLGANNSKGHQSTELGVLLHGILVILLNIVGEVVDGDAVVFDVLHNQFLGLGQFCGGEGVGLADDGNNVDTGGQALHQFDIEFAETVAGRCDEVEQHVHTVVPETGVTLNARLLCKNVIILALEVADNLAEAVMGC